MNKYLIFIASILVITNVISVINLSHYKRSYLILSEIMSKEVQKNTPLKLNFTANIENNDIQIDSIQLEKNNCQRLSLKDFFTDEKEKVVVCRFSEMNCESCITHSINTLLKWSSYLGKENILYIGAYRNDEIFENQKKLYGINSFHSLNIRNLNIPIEDFGYPYYFVLDRSLKVLDLFIPNKSSMSDIQNYFNAINEKYFK